MTSQAIDACVIRKPWMFLFCWLAARRAFIGSVDALL
jgi:hypothetical protein